MIAYLWVWPPSVIFSIGVHSTANLVMAAIAATLSPRTVGP